MTKRVRIKDTVKDSVLVEARRRCCICFGLNRDFARKKGQIAHLDGNRANAAESNLVFLCLDHHDELDSRSSQSKNLTRGEVCRFRKELSEHIRVVFNQEHEQQHVETMVFSESLPDLRGSECPLTAIKDESERHAPSYWTLRYKFDFQSAAHLGRFHKDSRNITVFDEYHCSWHFQDSAEDFWKFEAPEHLREEIANSGANILSAFVGNGWSAHIYARTNGDLAVCTLTFTENDVTGENWDILKAHRTKPCFAGFAPDGSVLLTGDEAGELLVWDWPSRRKKYRLPSLVGPVASAYLNYEIDKAVVTGRNGAFEIFELSTSRSLASGTANIKGNSAQVHFSLDPAYLVAHDAADRFEALEAATLKVAPKDLWPLIWVNLKSSADRQVLAVWTVAGAVLAAVRETQESVERDAFEMLSPLDRRVSDYDVSPDGNRIALMIERRNLLVWERAE